MNWKRIILFGLGAFLTSEAATLVVGVPRFGGWRSLLFLAAALIPTIVFMSWFTVVQRDRTVLHVSLAAALEWLLSFMPSAVANMPEPLVWVSSLLGWAAAAGMGLGVGLVLRKMSDAN